MSAAKKRPFTAEDLYQLQLAADSQISPDGRHVIFSVSRVDRKTEKKYANLWLAESDGRTPPRQFTCGDQTDNHPRWSPDGRTIAFLSNRKDEKQAQIHLIPVDGGEARPLTDVKGSFATFVWSPDGRTLAAQFRKKDQEAIEREEDEQKKELGIVARHITSLDYKFDGAGYLPQEKWHIWTFDAATGEGTQLTDGDFHETDPRWSPDGRTLLCLSNRHPDPDLHPDAVDLYLIPAKGGEMEKVATDHNVRKFNPSFSPDGRQIAFMGAARPGDWYQNTSLYVTPTAGGAARNLTAAHDLTIGDYTLSDTPSGTPLPPPTWSGDGRTLYVIASRHGKQSLLAFDAADGSYQPVIDAPGAVRSFHFNANQTQLAYLWGDIENIAQVCTRQVNDGASHTLTHFNEDWLAEKERGQIEEIWFQGPDGDNLQGWILKPPGFDPAQKYPSILEIHGGPYAQYGQGFMHEFQYLAAQGYVVYFANPRGSQGYGEAFAGAIANQWGTVDYADLMAWADYVERQPYIDPERMGVTGGSYGGYMTTLIIGKTNRFKAAAAQRLVSNLVSFYGSSDMNWMLQMLLGTDTQPWDDLEDYWQQSPISLIGNARTPTLIIHSEKDYRCDREQGEQVFVALRKQGVETEMVLFPDESHGLSRNGRTDRRIQRLEHIARWFNKYLKA
ncbi:MAG TPA: S9 family peptidase [Anaerolineae bacterium]|nr:S9 family peptidase [Anaerolineae bacterium]